MDIHSTNRDTPYPSPPEIPERLALVGRYENFRQANDHALVILSMRLPYWMFEHEKAYYLCAEVSELGAIEQQLAKYQEESKTWPPMQKPFPKDRDAAWFVPLGYSVALILIYMTQLKFPQLLEVKGAMESTQFLSGQGWRAITALTLHADVPHLAANLLALFCFGLLVNRTVGAGVGWCYILLSGGLGNTITACLYASTHRSLGASTAVFGAMGILIGHAIATQFSPQSKQTVKYRLVPVLAGLFLLASMGAGGEQTDVLAHVFGFMAGTAIGFIDAYLSMKIQLTHAIDDLLLVVPPIVVLACWWLAF